MLTVLSVFGTRPEAIKMAPVVRRLQEVPDRIRCITCVTAQHRQMLDQVLRFFHIQPHYDLDVMAEGQGLSALTAKILNSLSAVIDEVHPHWILVQGDTTTCMAASLAGFYAGIKIGHVEAGLRTCNKRAPFPEEINRRITTAIADLHFAPTERARTTLLSEGIAERDICVTGNTVTDALRWALDEMADAAAPELPRELAQLPADARVVLVTSHRRESFGQGMIEICSALKTIAERYPDLHIIFPVHLNPNVRGPAYEILKTTTNIALIEPLAYPAFVWLMHRSYLIMTDSGGIQEEAPSLGTPVIVMRDTTERPEGIAAGCAILAGTRADQIVGVTKSLLLDSKRYDAMRRVQNPYGDGHAAYRIVDRLLRRHASKGSN